MQKTEETGKKKQIFKPGFDLSVKPKTSQNIWGWWFLAIITGLFLLAFFGYLITKYFSMS